MRNNKNKPNKNRSTKNTVYKAIVISSFFTMLIATLPFLQIEASTKTNGQSRYQKNQSDSDRTSKKSFDLVNNGSIFSLIDKNAKYGGTYYVEHTDKNGNRRMYGSVGPNMKFEEGRYGQPSSDILRNLVSTDNRSSQEEFVGGLPAADSSSNSFRGYASSANPDRQKEIAAMPGVKLSVKDVGWYRVTMNQLAQAGFDVNSDKTLWQLFADGTEVPMQIRYNQPDGNYTLEFYGEGVETKQTDEQIYYLVVGNQAGMRLSELKGGNVEGAVTAHKYQATVRRKDRSLYMPALLNGDDENWFGPIVFPTSTTTQLLKVSDPYDDGTNEAVVRVKLQGLTEVQHFVNVGFNDFPLGVVEFWGKENQEFEFNVPMSALYSDINEVKLQSVGASNDYSLVDEVSLTYEKGYMAENGQIRFSVPAFQTARVGGFDDIGFQVYEIGLDGRVVREIGTDEEKVNSTAGFPLAAKDYDREFIAVHQAEFSRTVANIKVNNPTSWNNPTNRADFVIITPQILEAEANSLAERRRLQGWDTAVVRVEDIYDEYNFGRRSNEAIKAFLADASSNWELKPTHVLLFGDSSADHKNYLNQVNRNLVPTKLVDTQFTETANDGWLADFDNDGIEDLSIGRLPVGNSAEAQSMLAKLARYDQQEAHAENKNLLVADNLFDSYTDFLAEQLPDGATALKVNRSQMSDSQMRSEIISKMALNPMVVTYTGHGSTGVWVNANVLRDADVASFSNDKLSFFMLMTCLNGYTHSPFGESLSEVLVKSQNGAVAAWASSGETYASSQIFMSRDATINLFDVSNNPMTIGNVTRSAKGTTTDMDARRTWQLIGDPTIVIK